MWAILKFEKRDIHQLKYELSKKLGSEPKFFIPKIKLQNFSKNKAKNTEWFLLGNYLLCYHSKFKNSTTITTLKNCKGLKYFLSGFINSQSEILKFIDRCKSHQDSNGYIKQSFFSSKL